jgi:hypothetical protein
VDESLNTAESQLIKEHEVGERPCAKGPLKSATLEIDKNNSSR